MLEELASLIITWGIVSLIFFAGGCAGWVMHKTLSEKPVDNEEDMILHLRKQDKS